MAVRVIEGDCGAALAALPPGGFQACVTSPPYFGLRDYGAAGQIGLEDTPAAYVARLVEVFRQVRRVLRPDGTLWLNLGDSYNTPNNRRDASAYVDGGKTRLREQEPNRRASQKYDHSIKPKDLLGMPWRVAFALQADGWFLRSAIVWAKPNPMPESVTDRPTSSYEHVFLLAARERYFYDAEAIAEPAEYPGDDRHNRTDARKLSDPMCLDGGSRARTGNPTGDTRNARNVWTIATQPYAGAHFATMPPDLVERCILAGSRPGDAVLDPFGGAGTTGLVADRLRRDATLIELNTDYARLARARITDDAPLFAEVA